MIEIMSGGGIKSNNFKRLKIFFKKRKYCYGVGVEAAGVC